MLKICGLTIKNFLSIGNVAQALKLDEDGLTLVLGENVDVGGRNGVGKSAILQAISYALFGKPLTQIKADNLINSINIKQMLVTIEFERDGRSYRIERGRKPNVLRWYVNDGLIENATDNDEAQGENRKTQEDIEKVLGFSHIMFKHIIALNTFTDPFLRMKVADQRAVIEELLGVTQMSTKADALKELIRGTKDSIKEEEFRLKALQESNQRIQNSVNDLELRSRQWEADYQRRLKRTETELAALLTLDIDAEIAAHRLLFSERDRQRAYTSLERGLRTTEDKLKRLTSSLEQTETDLAAALAKSCPTCRQTIHSDAIVGISQRAEQTATRLFSELEQSVAERNNLTDEMAALGVPLDTLPQPFYSDLEKALEHRQTVQRLHDAAAADRAQHNPYRDQIDTLRHEGMQPVTYDAVNALNTVLQHQDFLVKLLLNKDSFIRKKIIDQNLTYLNQRLGHYLQKLGLPHDVRFLSDLSVEITLLGRDFDFEQLSRGEMNRIILATSWSFRDVWESLNNAINVLFVDEMIDSGLDQIGAEAALEVLKSMSRDRQKNILLISHKDELISRVNRILMVRKEKSFSRFDENVDAAQ